jgi:hypothetical protein
VVHIEMGCAGVNWVQVASGDALNVDGGNKWLGTDQERW